MDVVEVVTRLVVACIEWSPGTGMQRGARDTKFEETHKVGARTEAALCPEVSGNSPIPHWCRGTQGWCRACWDGVNLPLDNLLALLNEIFLQKLWPDSAIVITRNLKVGMG